MITSEKIDLNAGQRERIVGFIEEINDFLGKKYPIYSVVLTFSILILIVFFIYLYEDYSFSIILKLLTILPLSAIVVVNLKFFHNRYPAVRHRLACNKLLRDNYYKALRVKPTRCEMYSDGLNDYFLFEAGQKEKLLLRLQDFTVDMDRFPNDNFLIPPYGLFDTVGNELVIEGNKIETNSGNRDISKQLTFFGFFESGRVLITAEI